MTTTKEETRRGKIYFFIYCYLSARISPQSLCNLIYLYLFRYSPIYIFLYIFLLFIAPLFCLFVCVYVYFMETLSFLTWALG